MYTFALRFEETTSSMADMSCRRGAAICALMLTIAAAVACREARNFPFIWVDDWRDPAPLTAPDEYVIAVGDELNVQVWQEEKVSGLVHVRSDGHISLPFVKDVKAAGLTPLALARDLEERLKQIILAPRVTVAVGAPRPLSVSVLGKVAQPGLHNLEPGAGVVQALAAAGGLRDFAHRDRIYVVRSNMGKPSRIRMTYDALTAGQGRAAALKLRSGDVVVVE
jgi:polysaccharide biosynthesis/export protein